MSPSQNSEPDLVGSISIGAIIGFLLGLTGCGVIFTAPLAGAIIGAVFGLGRYLISAEERKNRR